MAREIPVIEDTGEGKVLLTCPYDPDFVEELKAALPADERSWDPDGRVWVIDDDHVEQVADMVRDYFKECEIR